MLFYRLLICVLWLPVALVLLGRVLIGRESGRDWLERVGLAAPRSNGPHVWVHAASNGELASARPIILALQARRPDLGLLITTNSLSGRDMAHALDMPGLTACLAPLDTRWSAARLIRRCQVVGLVVIESEFWPNRITTVFRRGRPVFVLGARLSRRSARTWRRMAPLARALQACITYLSPQDKGSRRRFLRLGATPAQFGPMLDLKAFYTPPKDMVPDDGLLAAFDRENTWLAASTHAGEEEIILQAHQSLRAIWPELQLIIAPRHSHRGDAVVAQARALGLDVAQRSLGDAPRVGAVYVADTFGEMALWYHLAAITFVGGSLVKKGGHTPFEPAYFDSVVLHGPHLRNFLAIYRKLDLTGGAMQVDSAQGLHDALLQLRDPVQREAMQRHAKAALAQPEDLENVLNALLDALPDSPQTA